MTFHNGLRKVGATVVPSGTSSSQIQVQLIKDLKVTAYVGTPSFLMSIIDKSKELGYNFKKDFRVKKACFAAEPLLPWLRQTFEKEHGIDTYQMYGATEVGDVAYECSQEIRLAYLRGNDCGNCRSGNGQKCRSGRTGRSGGNPSQRYFLPAALRHR
ncbi:MAG: AMP-binding protein [Candidatus Moduliflexus flocculans]|nr:AMP-binding protein [Candidatus Moduliflexus flocculans]